MSVYNHKRKEFNDCIDEQEGQTGSTFHGIRTQVEQDRPLLLSFENVTGLSGKNLRAVLRIFVLWDIWSSTMSMTLSITVCLPADDGFGLWLCSLLRTHKTWH